MALGAYGNLGAAHNVARSPAQATATSVCIEHHHGMHSTNPPSATAVPQLQRTALRYAVFSPNSSAHACGSNLAKSKGLSFGSSRSLSRRYSKGSTPASSQLRTMLNRTPAAQAPRSDPMNSQFSRPMTGPRSSR